MISKFSLLAFCFFTFSASASLTDHSQFESFIEKRMKEQVVPGLAVAVVSSEDILYMKGFGVRSVETGRPVTPDTQFAIGSTSKAFTATGLGLLVDRGQVGWDKPVKENYLPDFELMSPHATELMTARDLLTHRSGLPGHDLVWYGSSLSREELYNRLKYLEPSASIRQEVQYQNLMFMVAGYLTGKVAGTSWEDFIQTEIFQPLGMNNSNFSVIDMQEAANFATPHVAANGNAQPIPFRNLDAVAPAGSINSSVRDMAQWLQFQLNKGEVGGHQLVAKETMEEIHSPQMVSEIMGFNKQFDEFGIEHYGLGWMVQTYHGETLVHHGGGIDGFITFVGFLPEKDLGLIVVSNAGSMLPYAAGFAYLDLVLKGETGPWEERLKKMSQTPELETTPATQSPVPLKAYAGTYEHPAYGTVRIIVDEQQEALVFQHHGATFKMGHHKDHAFLPILPSGEVVLGQHPVKFETRAAGDVIGFSWKPDGRTPPVKFVQVE